MLEPAHQALAAIDPLGCTRPELCDQLGALARLESHLIERRLAVTAAIDALDDDGVDGAGVNRSIGRCSGRRARQLADTAAQLGEMPSARAALAGGAITAEHADALARAAADVEPAQVDDELVTVAVATPADLFARKAREWVAAHERPADTEARHAAQRAARTARCWTDAAGMWWLLVSTDAVTGAEIQTRLDQTTDRLWRADGGREGAPDAVRTPGQRRADAVYELLGADEAAPDRPTTSPGRHPRHQLLAIADTTRLGIDPAGFAGIVDGEPLPHSVLERLACDAAITPILFNGPGEILWQGRAVRTARPAQWKGLIARDGGCVLCGVRPSMCEAHHLIPWLALGGTDITNLALVCSFHHHLIHDTRSALVCADGVWNLRPRAGPLTRAA